MSTNSKKAVFKTLKPLKIKKKRIKQFYDLKVVQKYNFSFKKIRL